MLSILVLVNTDYRCILCSRTSSLLLCMPINCLALFGPPVILDSRYDIHGGSFMAPDAATPMTCTSAVGGAALDAAAPAAAQGGSSCKSSGSL